MIKNLFIIALACFLCSCNRVKNLDSTDTFEVKELTKRELSPDMLKVDADSISDDYSEELEAGLFGKFYGDRAEFFIIKDPENKIYDEQVKMIVLSFLDGQLCQTKYHVANDISDKLFKQYGKFYIVGFDEPNREILKKEGATTGDSTQARLNTKLTNYELVWRLTSKDIRFRVNKDDLKSPFQYVERLANYENLLRKIELAEN